MKEGVKRGLTLPGDVKQMITTSYVIRNALSLKLLFESHNHFVSCMVPVGFFGDSSFAR